MPSATGTSNTTWPSSCAAVLTAKSGRPATMRAFTETSAVPGKPVGTVWFGLARRGRPVRALRHVFPGDRTAVRAATVAEALRLLDEAA